MQPGQRYFSPWQILIGAMLGGPIAGGFLASRDHAVFGAPGRGRAILLVSGMVMAGMFVLVLGPGSKEDPGAMVVGACVPWAYGIYARAVFAGEISKRAQAGWQQHSWWRVFVVCLGFLLGLIGLVAVAILSFSGE